jgi:hypothetical protein
MASQTVKQFVDDSYQLVSANTPTVPLQGNDMLKGIQFFNELLQEYSANALLITIAKSITFNMAIGQSEVTFGAADYVPTPNVTTFGRLANAQNVWLTLQGVTYPLIIEDRNVFLASYKYDPQLGLPRFAIIYNETDLTRMRIYPAPSQVFTLNVYGKFQLPPLGQNDTMSIIPQYALKYLKIALAQELSFYKGRSEAWTDKLQKRYNDARQEMEAASSLNLVVDTSNESYLNGAWRVRSGI